MGLYRVQTEAETLARQGDLSAARARLEELLSWLKESGEDKLYEAELSLQIEALAAGKNPFGE